MSKPSRLRSRGFTIIELLVVVSIIALLVGILLPAIGKARDQAKTTLSFANLRNIGAAHGSYAAEWQDRQLTFIDDNFASYGSSPPTALDGYEEAWNDTHPPIVLGWAAGQGGHNDSGGNRYWGYWPCCGTRGNVYRIMPLSWYSTLKYFGSFRIINAKQFSQYLGERFYDPVFYAPKDRIVWETVRPCIEDPAEFCTSINTPAGGVGWSSYVMSPAAMFSPDVFRSESEGGFQDPFELGGGAYRSPSTSQCLYPSLKTRVLEHHWLQSAKAACNPAFSPGTYGGCEPYYFNQAWESAPVTLFYDGHVEAVGTKEAQRADGQLRAQDADGLWSRDTPLLEDGYMSDLGYDQSETSYHILTTNGIRGRDITSN